MEEEIITSSLEVTEHWQESLRAEQKGGAGLEWVCAMCCRQRSWKMVHKVDSHHPVHSPARPGKLHDLFPISALHTMNEFARQKMQAGNLISTAQSNMLHQGGKELRHSDTPPMEYLYF